MSPTTIYSAIPVQRYRLHIRSTRWSERRAFPAPLPLSCRARYHCLLSALVFPVGSLHADSAQPVAIPFCTGRDCRPWTGNHAALGSILLTFGRVVPLRAAVIFPVQLQKSKDRGWLPLQPHSILFQDPVASHPGVGIRVQGVGWLGAHLGPSVPHLSVRN